MSAACILAAIGAEDRENDSEYVRAYVGAMILAEGIHELRLIRKSLSQKP